MGGSWASITRTCTGRVRAQQDVASPSTAASLTTPSEGSRGRRRSVSWRARRMVRRLVERGEVVVVVLDLRALGDLVAEAEEDVDDLAPESASAMQVRDPTGRRAGQGDVDRLARASPRARLARALDPCPSSSARGPGEPRCRRPDPPRWPRGRSAIPRRIASARTCGPGSGPGARRARERPAPRRSQRRCCRELRSGPASVSRSRRRRYPPERDRRRRGDVERFGAARGAAGSSPRSHAASTSIREPVALGPEAESRPASAGRAAPRRGDERGPGLGRLRRASATGGRTIEPMLARTAFGEYGSAQPGPRTTIGPQSACGPHHGADVAGVTDPVQVDADRSPIGSAQRLRLDARSRGSPIRACTLGEQRRLDLLPARRRHSGGIRPLRRPRRAGPLPRSRTGPRGRGACAPPASGSASASRCPCW